MKKHKTFKEIGDVPVFDFNKRDYNISYTSCRALRCVCCNKILFNGSTNDMCSTCQRRSSEFYVYNDFNIETWREYPLEFEKEEFDYLQKEAVYIE